MSDLSNSKEELVFKLSHCDLTEEEYKLAINPEFSDVIMTDLDKTVKHDKPVKRSVFAVGISSFLPDPINLFQKGESGVGKTYTTVQSLKYFSPSNVWFLGGVSPKALIHDRGTILTEDGRPVEEIERPEKPRKNDFSDVNEFREEMQLYKTAIKKYVDTMRKTYALIELSGKTLVFLQAPDPRTFDMLYPILSHDKEEIEYKFVDRPAKGEMRTMKVIIRGWPATVFLSIEKGYMEETATRGFTVTPESSKDKFIDANKLTNDKSAYPWNYVESEETIKIRNIIAIIRAWFEKTKADIIIPFDNLNELFPSEIVRDMRDFQHFIQFLKTITAIHLFQRPQLRLENRTYVISTLYDVLLAFMVYSEIFESTRTNTDKVLLDFFHKIITVKPNWYLTELTEEYNAQNPKKASSETIRKKLVRLEDIGYVNKEEGKDKRFNVYHPLNVISELSTIKHKPETCPLDLSKLEKGFKKWSEQCTQKYPNYNNTFFSPIPSEQPLTTEDLARTILDKKSVLFIQTNFVAIDSGKNEPSTQETEPKTSHVGKRCLIVDNSEVPIVALHKLAKTYGLDRCAVCGEMKPSVWQADISKSNWKMLCAECGEQLDRESTEEVEQD